MCLFLWLLLIKYLIWYIYLHNLDSRCDSYDYSKFSIEIDCHDRFGFDYPYLPRSDLMCPIYLILLLISISPMPIMNDFR